MVLRIHVGAHAIPPVKLIKQRVVQEWALNHLGQVENLPSLSKNLVHVFRDICSNGAQHQESPKAISVVAPCQSGVTGDDKLANQKPKRPESTATKSRKRKGRSDQVASRSKGQKEITKASS
ncbi:hypothetical protein SDJN03_15086, partial [Cucurbita argyrosperma subsp. sororia]